MKRFSLFAAILIVMTAISALAAPSPPTAKVPALPGTLANASYGRRLVRCRTPSKVGAN
jgi:hypothetical protein